MPAKKADKIDTLIKQLSNEIKKVGKRKTANKNVQAFADIHYGLKQKRDAISDLEDQVKAILARIEEEAKVKYEKEGIEGARGENATAYIQELDHYGIADRSKLDKYVKRTGNFELFQNRVSGAAIEEIQANNKRFKIASVGVSLHTSTHYRTRKR